MVLFGKDLLICKKNAVQCKNFKAVQVKQTNDLVLIVLPFKIGIYAFVQPFSGFTLFFFPAYRFSTVSIQNRPDIRDIRKNSKS